MTTSAREVSLVGDEATRELGRRIGRALGAGGCVLALSGHLGAGKTTFVKGLAEGMGVAAAQDVTSPTFLRAVRFEGPVPLVHVDAWRMKGAADLVELGLDEDMAGGACVAIEGPENVAAGLPRDHLTVELRHVDTSRRVAVVFANGPEAASLLARTDFRGVGDGNPS